MSQKVAVTLSWLKGLREIAIARGTTDAWGDLILQWAEEAEKEIKRLKAELKEKTNGAS